jgi:hypothetical protein
MVWDIKQMTLDVDGGRYEISWQPGTGGFALMMHAFAPSPFINGVRGSSIAIDDRFPGGDAMDWETLEDAKAACACHAELCKTMNPWDAAECVWKELRKEAQAEEAANRWDANDYIGDGL